jgi:formylglycine-generating enzyme required for sulfatase activity
MKKLMKTTNETTLQKTLGRRSLGKVGMILGGVLFLSGAIVRADSFGTGANGFTLDFVVVGNAGNGNDAGTGGSYGGVAYDYRMGVNEISQAAINAAVAGGLTGMTAGNWSGNQPATSINWYQAAAFTNWLNTSTGHVAAYQLNAGLTEMTVWSSADAWQVGGENLYRNKDAYYFLPSENEWYKAAYQKNDGVTANYWDYPTGSNSAPIAVASGTGAGTAVYDDGYAGSEPASVFSAGGLSAYGTMGQGGNVFEWMETAYDGINNTSSEWRGIRGGYWGYPEHVLRSSDRHDNLPPSNLLHILGFRVASVPEPSAAMLMISAGMLALARRRTRAAL